MVSLDNTKSLLERDHEAAHQRQPMMIRWQIHRQSPQRYSSSQPCPIFKVHEKKLSI